MDLTKIWIFRIVPVRNLEFILRNGLYCKNAGKKDEGFITIGSKEIIMQRDSRIVKCFPETVVNDYVPFYFSVRTPMLYNIVTGHGVSASPQQEIVYLCFKLRDLATDDFQWCYTNGNAAKSITKFFVDLNDVETKLDWRSINTTDFRDENADGDEDRIRKKHAEFLVKYHVPTDYVKGIVVYNQSKKDQVETILAENGRRMKVIIKKEFYF